MLGLLTTGKEIIRAESLFDLKVESESQTNWQGRGSFGPATKISLFHDEPADTKDVIGIVRRGDHDHPIPDVALRNHRSSTPRSITGRSAYL